MFGSARTSARSALAPRDAPKARTSHPTATNGTGLASSRRTGPRAGPGGSTSPRGGPRRPSATSPTSTKTDWKPTREQPKTDHGRMPWMRTCTATPLPPRVRPATARPAGVTARGTTVEDRTLAGAVARVRPEPTRALRHPDHPVHPDPPGTSLTSPDDLQISLGQLRTPGIFTTREFRGRHDGVRGRGHKAGPRASGSPERRARSGRTIHLRAAGSA